MSYFKPRTGFIFQTGHDRAETGAMCVCLACYSKYHIITGGQKKRILTSEKEGRGFQWNKRMGAQHLSDILFIVSGFHCVGLVGEQHFLKKN